MIKFNIKSKLFDWPIGCGGQIVYFIYIICNYKIVV
jgi:hypothetical protein